MRIDFEERIKEAIQIARENDTGPGHKRDIVELCMNPDTAKFLDIKSIVGPEVSIVTDNWWIGNNIYVVSHEAGPEPGRYRNEICRKVIPDDWGTFFDREHPPPLYRCQCRRSLHPDECSPLSCICQGSGKLTWGEALEMYGFIPHSKEVPYCNICLNQNRDELFPYSLFDFGDNDNSNVRFIYRCRAHHGHDKGWLLWDIFMGEMVRVDVTS